MSMFDLFMEKLKLEVDPDEISQEEFVGKFNEFIDASANILLEAFMTIQKSTSALKRLRITFSLKTIKKYGKQDLKSLRY